MNRVFTAILIGLFMLCSVLESGFAQDDEAGLDVAHCKTIQEINDAKARKADFIEIRGSYQVLINGEYKGPFPSLRKAVEAKQAVEGSSGTASQAAPKISLKDYNPLSVLYPFTDLTEKGLTFTVPGGTVVEASQVMIHHEPFIFDELSFGLLTIRKDSNPFFAVTGLVRAQDGIKAATEALTFSAAAAVVGVDGSTLWQTYGVVEKDLGFRCIMEVKEAKVPPAFLLVFVMAEGKLPKLLSSMEGSPDMDASGYRYHVLCTATLEMAENWMPPLDEITKEEYLKLYKEQQDKRKNQQEKQP